MKKVNRIKNIVAAGTLTGLALAVTLAFGGQDVLGTKPAPPENSPVLSDVESMSAQSPTKLQLSAEQRDSLQAQNEELTRALLIMREREGQYQGLIKSANQTIQQLQAEAATLPYQGEYNQAEEEEQSQYEAEHEEGDDAYEDDDDGYDEEAYEREDEDDD